jgi:hypothetical protein
MDPAAEINQDAFAAGRADVDTEDNLPHYFLTARSPRPAHEERAGRTLMISWRQSAWPTFIMRIILPQAEAQSIDET